MAAPLEAIMESHLYTAPLQQPWRRVSKPSEQNADLCPAEISDIEWEVGTRWWTCTKCKFIGKLSWLGHYPAHNPNTKYKTVAYVAGATAVVGFLTLAVKYVFSDDE